MHEIRNCDSPIFYRAAEEHLNEGSDGVQLPVVPYVLDTFVGSLATFAAKGNVLLQDENVELLRNKVAHSESTGLHLVENASSKSARVL